MIFATKLYSGKTSDQSERSRCSMKLQKVGFLVKTRRNLYLVCCARKTHCFPMCCMYRQIPRCVLTWVLVVVAFCYDVLCEPCDGFSDLPLVLLGCSSWNEFYLCFGCTWVHVTTKKDLLKLICFWWGFTFYLCLCGTWVPVVTKKGSLWLLKVVATCF